MSSARLDRFRALHVLLWSLLLASFRLAAAAEPVDVYVFWRVGCPHCEREIEFLRAFQAREPRLRLHLLEVGSDPAHRRLLTAVAQRLQARKLAVPFTVVGDQVVIGYYDDASTGVELDRMVRLCLERRCPNPVGELMVRSDGATGAPSRLHTRLPETLRLPLLGEVSTRDLSLPALTLVLGAVDGFNPCAMWTLLFLIGLLVGMQDRARMWALGTAFIAASAAVYFLFMAAWLNLLLFLGMLPWVRVAIGAVAIAGGAYYLREFVVNREAVCKVTGQERRRRVFERLRQLASERRFLLALGGMVLLAFAVNLVELLCSAGIPAVYTQVLAFSDLPAWRYYAYLLLYVLVFMLDDLVVFFTAMATLQVSGLTAAYSRYAHLVGGVVLVAIGALMWLRPEWLMFG
jgi:hypothetical protein